MTVRRQTGLGRVAYNYRSSISTGVFIALVVLVMLVLLVENNRFVGTFLLLKLSIRLTRLSGLGLHWFHLTWGFSTSICRGRKACLRCALFKEYIELNCSCISGIDYSSARKMRPRLNHMGWPCDNCTFG